MINIARQIVIHKKWVLRIIAICIFAGTTSTYANAQVITLGVYYYPGWRDNVLGNVSPQPWNVIKKYPERQPKLGFYDDGDPAVIDQQLSWMADAGINFLIMDWYWNHKLGALKSHALAAYYKAPNRSKINLSIMWANHTEFPQSRAEFEKMVRFWLYYFRTNEYMRVDGKPLVFIFSSTELEKKAQSFGSNTAELLQAAQTIARGDGLPGIFFVGGGGANSPVPSKHSKGVVTGYDAFSAYNYQGPSTYKYSQGHSSSHSYAELSEAYQNQWRWMLSEAKLPYFVPMTVGWDRRPWGGSDDPLHDNSVATPEEFEQHLALGLKEIKRNIDKTKGIGVICCWNEFGEGSYIEPTQAGGDIFLSRIRKVFGKQGSPN